MSRVFQQDFFIFSSTFFSKLIYLHFITLNKWAPKTYQNVVYAQSEHAIKGQAEIEFRR